jgi:hypothetical protein
MKFDVYGRIMMITSEKNNGSYHPTVADAIFNALNTKPDFLKYKQKQ